MSDAETAALIGVIGGGGTAIMAFARWAVRLWATIRREGIVASKEAAAEARADTALMVAALREQAASNATLAGEIRQLGASLGAKLDGMEWRDRTPVESQRVDPPGPIVTETASERRRREQRTQGQGYRSPRPGNRDD